MQSRTQQKPPPVLGAHGFSVEVAGRDRVRYFRTPLEATGAEMKYSGMGTMHLAANSSVHLSLGDHVGLDASTMTRTLRGRPYRLPSLPRDKRGGTLRKTKLNTTSTEIVDGAREAAIQTAFRENETQTLPYSPEYVIPEGCDPNPQVLGLSELHWDSGLPAGVEEVELIQRLRRRRDVEATLPEGNDEESRVTRFRALCALEKQERDEREDHHSKLQQRRLDEIWDALQEREQARDEANRRRMEAVKAERLANLKKLIVRVETRRIAVGHKMIEDGTLKATNSEARGLYAVDPVEALRPKRDLIECYSKHGIARAPPKVVAGCMGAAEQRRPSPDAYRYYDVRPSMLSTEAGIKELEEKRIQHIQKLPKDAFVAPENYAMESLPSLYQRREAARVVDALEYVHSKIHDSGVPAETVRVLELYRTTPRPQRPDTPELELEGDAEEMVEESCILLQRLLRGRAVQNDFFDGKERCRGLIEELQAASNAKYAERSPEEKRIEEEMKLREAIADSVADEAQGDIIVDTLDYLFHEMTRQRDLRALEALRHEAEAVRAEREAREAELRAQERILHDKEAIQYTAYIRAIDDVVECYSHQLYVVAAEDCALEEAIDSECKRLEELPTPITEVKEPAVLENLVCDILDNFVLPTVIDMVLMKPDEMDRKAPAVVAAGVAANIMEKTTT